MRTFPLRIGTPDGLLFEGEVQRVVCRSITGDMAIMAGHCNFCTALATTWEWQEDIDADRAGEAKERAQEKLAKGGLSDKEYKIAEAKLQRALVRLSVKS